MNEVVLLLFSVYFISITLYCAAVTKNLSLSARIIPMAYIFLFFFGYCINLIVMKYGESHELSSAIVYHYPVSDSSMFFAMSLVSINYLILALLVRLYTNACASISRRKSCVTPVLGSSKIFDIRMAYFATIVMLILLFNTTELYSEGIGIRGVEIADNNTLAGILLNIQTTLIPTLIFSGMVFSISANRESWARVFYAIIVLYVAMEVTYRQTKVVFLVALVMLVLASELRRSQMKKLPVLSYLGFAVLFIVILNVYTYVNTGVTMDGASLYFIEPPGAYLDEISFILRSVLDRITGVNSLLDMIAIENLRPIGMDFLDFDNYVVGNQFTETVYSMPKGFGHTSAPGLLGFFYFTFGTAGSIFFVQATIIIFLSISYLIEKNVKFVQVKIILAFLLVLYWLPINIDGIIDEQFVLNWSGVKKSFGVVMIALLVSEIMPRLFISTKR